MGILALLTALKYRHCHIIIRIDTENAVELLLGLISFYMIRLSRRCNQRLQVDWLDLRPLVGLKPQVLGSQ